MLQNVKCNGWNVKVDKAWEELFMKCCSDDVDEDKEEYAEYCEKQLIGNIPTKIDTPQNHPLEYHINSDRHKVNIALIFDDWKEGNKSIYQTLLGIELSKGDFHGGTLFHGVMELNEEEIETLGYATKQNAYPVFKVMTEWDYNAIYKEG